MRSGGAKDRRRRGALLTLLCAMLCGCASTTPRHEPSFAARAPVAPPQHALDRVQQEAFLQRVDLVEARMHHRPVTGGNRVQLLVNGPHSNAAMLDAIAGARDSIHLAMYIFDDDASGRIFLAALRARVAAGVKVRLVVDGVGARDMSAGFINEIRDAGIDLRVYGPVIPRLWRATRRAHRKILVIDGRIAFTGGMNIADAYTRSPSRAGFRDTNVRIEGPAVVEFQRLFFATWTEAGEPAEDEKSTRYWPVLQAIGDDRIRVVANEGAQSGDLSIEPGSPVVHGREVEGRRRAAHAIYGSYVAAIGQSQQRIWITQAYFAPNDAMIGLLKEAAARKVDVRIIVPAISDVRLLVSASRYHYDGLLAAGVHIYEYRRSVLHAKTAVIDGIWSTVGSSNFDFRSFIHNDEANAIIEGRVFATQMEQLFVADLRDTIEIDRQQWAKRGALERMRERLAVMWEYWI